MFSDFDHIPPKIIDNAKDRGTRVHDYCSRHALGGTILSIDKDCEPYFESFTKWFDEYVEEVFFSEERYYFDSAMLTGKLDLYCRAEGIGDALVIDIKTPQKQKASWLLQTAAYQWILEGNGLNPSGRGVLMLSNKGKMAKFVKHYRYEESRDLYKGLLDAYAFFDIAGENKYSKEKE
jgi:hypothetical protein